MFPGNRRYRLDRGRVGITRVTRRLAVTRESNTRSVAAKTRELPVEGDCRLVTHRAGTHGDDRASHDTATHGRCVVFALQVQFNDGAWQHAVIGFNERSLRCHIHNHGLMTWTNTHENDAVFFSALAPSCAPT